MTTPAADQLYAHPEDGNEDVPSCALFQLCHADGKACIPGNQPLHRSAVAGETHRNLEMVLAWPNGRRRDLLVNTAPLKDREGRSSGAVGLFQDITERKQALLELARRTAEFEAIFNSITDAVVFADTRRRVVMVNPAMTAIFGYGQDELLGKTTKFLYARKADYEEQGRKRYHTGAAMDHNVFQVPYRRKDGTVFIGETLGAQVRDATGKVLGFVGIHRDITQRKRAEEKIHKLNDELGDRIREVSERTLQLEAANKELEAFSYSVSHDLRTPLRAIEGFARMLMEDHAARLNREGLRLLDVIRSNTRIMGELIDDLLSLSRLGRQEIRAQELDLGAMVTAVFEELQAQAPERRLDLVLNPLPPAYGDRNLINQVLANLLGNAAKFTQPREKGIIEVGGWTEGKENIYFIKDNGVGFDMRYVEKIFGVFQRLHRREDFEGTGVGLAIVQRIINRHGGRVWATGKVDRGAEFYFAIPVKGEVKREVN
jgi:PAS domain S-box-containing protein